ncbi:MAG: very short patch repair endonuclease [Burkholderiaceae bacterium]|nr:very short patch repair endonuclease [Burkholderiaceae bacterium]
MTDIVDSQTRSRMMAGIRGRNTKPELALRHSLHALGLRYRLYVKGVPGKPDIVLPKYHAVIFVHGCFWHRHAGCRYATVPATRPEFWTTKFDANVARDAAVESALLKAGWRVGTVWECALRTDTGIAKTRDIVAAWLHSGDAVLEVGEADVGTAPRPEPDPGSR